MDEKFSPSDHVEMWKHYDNLRQSKNGTFLTANSILVAIAGFKATETPALVSAISILGIVVCFSWILLLARNSAYIAFHRHCAGGGTQGFWSPTSKTPSSGKLDRNMGIAFLVFWAVLLIWTLWTLLKCAPLA